MPAREWGSQVQFIGSQEITPMTPVKSGQIVGWVGYQSQMAPFTPEQYDILTQSSLEALAAQVQQLLMCTPKYILMSWNTADGVITDLQIGIVVEVGDSFYAEALRNCLFLDSWLFDLVSSSGELQTVLTNGRYFILTTEKPTTGGLTRNHLIIIIAGVGVAITVGGIWWYYHRRPKPHSPPPQIPNQYPRENMNYV